MNDHNNEKKENADNRPQEQEKILEEYLKPKRTQLKYWRYLFLFIVFLVLAWIYKSCVIDPTIKPAELLASIEVFNIDSKWIESEKIDTPEFKGIVLVPQISFQVRNIGKRELYYIYFLGVFRLLDSPKTLGEGTFMAFRKPLKPGEKSERIVLASKFGYRATSRQAFKQNSREWRSALVQVFVRSGTAELSLLKTFYVSRRIDGLDIDVTVTDKQYKDVVIENEIKKEK